MRRLPLSLSLSALLIASACATPPIVLTPSYEVGDARTYELEADAITTIDLGGGEQRQRTVLRARSVIEVIALDGEETTIRLTLTPTSFTRDGVEADPPARQRAELVVGPDGEVRSISSVGNVPADIIGADVQDLAPLLGTPLPEGRVRLGDTWTTPMPAPSGLPGARDGLERGRVSGARVVRGYDCAIVSLATRRPLVRERPVGGQTVRMAGTETSATEIAFAFRDGFAVEIHTTSDGIFDVGDGSFIGGTVTIASTTDLVLVEQR